MKPNRFYRRKAAAIKRKDAYGKLVELASKWEKEHEQFRMIAIEEGTILSRRLVY